MSVYFTGLRDQFALDISVTLKAGDVYRLWDCNLAGAHESDGAAMSTGLEASTSYFGCNH